MAKIQWKPGKGKSLRQKLEEKHPNHGKVTPIPARMQKAWGRGTMVIPRPTDVDTDMRAAAANLEFERAAQIRDQLRKIRNPDLVLVGDAGREKSA